MTVTPLTEQDRQDALEALATIEAALHPAELPELIQARIKAHKRAPLCSWVYGRLSELGDLAGADPRALYRIAAAVADDLPADVLRAERVLR